MKSLLLLSIIIFTTCQLIAQTEYYVSNIKGNIQRVTIYGVQFEESKGVVKLLDRQKEGLYWAYSYNEKGFLDTTFVKNSDHSIWVYSVAFYADNNKIDSSQTFESNKELSQTIYYSYNRNITIEQVYENHELIEQIESIYSESGQLKSVVQKMDDLLRSRVNRFNKRSQIVSSQYYSNDSKDTLTTTFDYNDSSEIIYSVETTPGEVSISTDFKYEYDDKNNWVTMYIYKGNQLQKVLKREIQYY